MGISDLTGAASNSLAASRMQGAVNAGQKNALVGGITQIGVGAMDAVGQKKLADILTQMGFDPNQAALIASQGPAAAAKAGIQKAREKLESDRITQAQTFETGRDEASRMFQTGRDAAQFGQQHELRATDFTNEGLAEERKTKNALALSERQAREEGELAAPVDDTLSIMGGSFPIKREAGQGDIYGRARKGSYMGEALHNVLGRTKEPTPPKATNPLDDDLKRAQIGNYNRQNQPESAEPKPWKPMTREEQLQFDKDKAESGRKPDAPPDATKQESNRAATMRLSLTATQAERFESLKQDPILLRGAAKEEFEALQTVADGVAGLDKETNATYMAYSDPEKIRFQKAMGWIK